MQRRRGGSSLLTVCTFVVAPCAALALVAGSGAPAGASPGSVRGSGLASGPAASPDTGIGGQLVATAAISAKDAWSVGGTDQPGQSDGQTLVEHWNGHAWVRVKSPNSPGSVVSSLDSISAVSADDIWASGSGAANSGAVFALVEHWNGSAWTRLDAPDNPASDINVLQAISADSATDVWIAADYVNTQGVWIPYAEHWNGSKWSIVPVPGPTGALQTFLTGVTALSASDIWIVGQCIDSAGVPVTLADHWNGSKWSVVTTPNPKGVQASGLSAVSGTSADDVWAVGNTTTEAGDTPSLVEHWNGSKWAVVSSPNPTHGTGAALASVSALSADDAWAVGENSFNNGNERTFTMHWDGTAWTTVRSPNVKGAQATALDGVSARAGNDVWATGAGYTAAGGATTVNLHWDGTAWSIAP